MQKVPMLVVPVIFLEGLLGFDERLSFSHMQVTGGSGRECEGGRKSDGKESWGVRKVTRNF